MLSDINQPLPKDRYINRELSWLAFNERVLEEAADTSIPILERVKFLSISGSNLDEFYAVRVAGLEHQRIHRPEKRSLDGLDADQQLAAIQQTVARLTEEQASYWDKLETLLSEENIIFVTAKGLRKQDKVWLQDWFSSEVLPIFSPHIFSKETEQPLPTSRICILFHVSSKDGNETTYYSAALPDGLPRFIELPLRSKDSDQTKRFITLEQVIALFADECFPEQVINALHPFRIIRDSSLSVADDADDLLATFHSALQRRASHFPVRLEVPKSTPKATQDYLINTLNIHKRQVMELKGLLQYSDCMELYALDRPQLKFTPLQVRFPERINDFDGDCFKAIAAKDIIVHHPYESFDVVVQFVRQAARDPNVRSIRQTLYRTSKDSPIVHALIQAAKAGKDVTVVVELKARFDEAANLQWGQALEEAGARVVYGMKGMKVHSKLSLVEREENSELKRYAHYGTGNYHPQTAKVYADLSFFTREPAFCDDAATVFEFLEGNITGEDLPNKLHYIALAPLTMRNTLLSLIEQEISFAEQGKPANIWVKVNSLNDPQLIDALYRASQAGVSIDLIVRGICCLKAGVLGLSENIRVKSIVGRFLEHTRIFCFGNGHRLPHRHAKVYISSADWMPRNMDRRIECMVPILNPTVHEQVLDQIMLANLRDVKQSWIMAQDTHYERLSYRDDSFVAHDFFMANPSLSGRGSALRSANLENEFTVNAGEGANIAVIDIGSNSVRLVIFDGLKRRPYPLHNEKVFCGLARGMDESGVLHPEGTQRAQAALVRFVQLIHAHQVDTVYCFATSAVRDAEDGTLFISKIEQRTNLDIQVLSGEEEARLSAMGIASAFYEADGVVGDLGGGSLELCSLNAMADVKVTEHTRDNHVAIRHTSSYPIGPLRINHLISRDIEAARELVLRYLHDFPFREYMYGKAFYTVGGSFRAIAKLHMAAIDNPLRIIEHYNLPADDLMDHLEVMIKTPVEKLSLITDKANISERRQEVLKGCALIMYEIIKLGKPSTVHFSTYGVREGLLYDQLDLNAQSEDPLRAGVCDMLYLLSPNMGKAWIHYAHELFEWTNPLFTDETHHMSRLRFAASVLCNIAWFEHTSYRAESSYHWVLDAGLPGIDHWERMFIATCIYHRYRHEMDAPLKSKTKQLLEDKWFNRAQTIGITMRFAYQLSSGACGILPRTNLHVENRYLVLTCHKDDRNLINDSVLKRFERLANVMQLVPKVS